MKVDRAIALYLRHLEVLHRSPRTIEAEEERLRRLVAYLAEMEIEDVEALGRDVVQDYPEALATSVTARGEPLRVTTQTNRLIAARNLLRWLHRRDYVAVDLSGSIELPREVHPLPKEVIEPAEMRRLLALPDVTTALGSRDRAMLEVLYSTGIRVSELIALAVEDLDLDGGYVRVRCGKGARDRVVPIGRVAAQVVRAYLHEARSSLVRDGAQRRVFVSATGRTLTRQRVATRVRQYVTRAGISKRITPHCFRVTCATGMLRNGARLRHLQEMLGHRSVDTLEPYLRLTIPELKEMHARYHPREQLGP